ncbi:hypothetical protein Patl1_24766 [Pistacia atlantica]|uniref:Uncharacterized protein n=1 Tax=Pistacia atlantica TaxID=434234 RepID=A0ACC1B2K5_9ROSI|nr:hypothetical protein Patl1_24766 [Pistacia atlantica]
MSTTIFGRDIAFALLILSSYFQTPLTYYAYTCRKLVLCPSGNKSKNVKEHISLCLVIADASGLCRGWEVYAVVRLFLLDQKKDKYLIVQDALGRERRFHRLKLEWGCDQYIPLTYLMMLLMGTLWRTRVFGAEVFVCKETITGKGECLSMIKDAPTCKHVWKVEDTPSKGKTP